jgi:ABC-type nitrate/sulfonate/bicarbonate transport system substrate-binding protein
MAGTSEEVLVMKRTAGLLGLAGVLVAMAACGGAAAPPASGATAGSGTSAPATASSAPAKPAAASSPAGSAAAKPSAATSAVGSAAAKPNASAAPASGLTKLVITTGSTTSIEGLVVSMAKEAGFYQRNGIDADVQLVSGGINSMAALVSGQVQVSMGGGAELLTSVAGGADLVSIGSTEPVYPTQLYVPADIKTLEDLRGKKVDVVNRGSSMDVAMRVLFKKIGLNIDKDVTVMAMGNHQNSVAALMNGSVQAVLDSPPSSAELEARGFHALFSMAELKLPSANNQIRMPRAYMAAHPDVTQKVVDSIVQTIAMAKKDKPQATQIMKKLLKLDNDGVVGETYDFHFNQVIPALPYPKTEYLADAVDQLSATNDKIKTLDLNTVIDPSFVQNSADRGLDKS